MRDLAGRTAVVTGAASGIGFSVARRLGHAGMNIVLADVDSQTLGAAADALGTEGVTTHSVVTDVSDADAVRALRDAALGAFGAVHVIHNNAGVALPPMPLWDVDDALWRWVVGVNVGGVFNGIRTFVPLFVEQNEGHVVNTSSLAGLRAGPRLGAYSATKHAVLALSESLAADLRRAGADVGVSVVCPSAVPTNLGATSERNRPANAPRPDITSPRNDGSVRYTVIEPDVIADKVLDAIIDNTLYVITHPETHAHIAPRFAAILDACPSPWMAADAGG